MDATCMDVPEIKTGSYPVAKTAAEKTANKNWKIVFMTIPRQCSLKEY